MANGKDWERLANFVLSERERAAWSQLDLAKLMRMDVKTVRRVEANHQVWKTTLAALERVFDWQPGSANDVLAGGLPTRKEPATGEPPWLIKGEVDLRDEAERTIWRITEVDEEVRWGHIQSYRKKLAGQQPE